MADNVVQQVPSETPSAASDPGQPQAPNLAMTPVADAATSAGDAEAAVPAAATAADQPPAEDGAELETAAAPEVDPAVAAWQTEFDRVKATPGSFDAWTALLSSTEKLNNLHCSRQAYDVFLANYPLCYGYWKKYADAEARLASPEAATAVFERGVVAVPYSVDLWGHYATHLASKGASDDVMAALFERGLAYVGVDYLSHVLWDKYLTFRASGVSQVSVADLYSRILHIPLKKLDDYHTRFQAFVVSQDVKALLRPEDFSRLSVQAAEQQKQEQVKQEEAAKEAQAAAASAAAAAAASTAGEGIAGAADANMTDAAAAPDAALKAEPGAAVKAEPDTDTPMSDAAAAAPEGTAGLLAEPSEDSLRAAYLRQMAEVYNATKEEWTRREQFESGIKRPYFHVKPIDNGQLTNWSRYLDYVEAKGDVGMTVRMFERCLVACANYPDFWARFVRYQEGIDNVAAKLVLERATALFCKQRPEMHMFAGQFHERHGDVLVARASFELVTGSLAPTLIEGVSQHANFERRQSNSEAACSLWESLLAQPTLKVAQKAFAVVLYAHFLWRVLRNVGKARGVYTNQAAECGDQILFWEGWVSFEEAVDGPDMAERVLGVYETATAPPAAAEAKPDAAAEESKAGMGQANGTVQEPVATQPKSEASAALHLTDAERQTLSLRAVVFADLHCETATLQRVSRQHSRHFTLPSSLYTAAGGAASRKRAAEAPAEAVAAKVAKPAIVAPPAQAPAAAMTAQYASQALPTAAVSQAYAAYPAYGAYPAHAAYAANQAAWGGAGYYSGYGY